MMQNFIRYWLYIVVFLCLMIVMLGGATRLTGSGLSITQWQPIHGVIPPLNKEQWLDEFAKYKQISQYQEINSTINVDGFKSLYWWEWSHRLLARIIGLVALLPFILSLFNALFAKNRNMSFLKRWIETPYVSYFLLVPLMIGLQGVIGWWMVYSGLAGSKLTSVSQYRLATHMISASIIIMFTTYWSRNFIHYSSKEAPRNIQLLAATLSIAVLAQIYFGALVAGLHAGLSYNTWPLIDNKIIPNNLFIMKPWWHNFFENVLTVQFVHRCFAYIVFLLSLVNVIYSYLLCKDSAHAKRSLILFIMICLQILFGVITLLCRVPIWLGVLHQFFALLIMVFAVMHWRGTKSNIS